MTMWAAIERFGYPTIPQELNGLNIHKLENVMTLNIDVYDLFSNLLLWFLPTVCLNEPCRVSYC